MTSPMMNLPPLGPPGSGAPAEENGAQGGRTLADLGYTDSTMRCGECGNYDGESSTCKLTNGEEVDPGGSCSSFTPGEQGNEADSEAPEAEQMEG